MSNKWIIYENSGLPQEQQIQVSVHRTARVNIMKPLAAWSDKTFQRQSAVPFEICGSCPISIILNKITKVSSTYRLDRFMNSELSCSSIAGTCSMCAVRSNPQSRRPTL